MSDKLASKTVHKDEEDDRKRQKALTEVKPVENINKNPQSFQEINPIQKKVLSSYKVQEHACEKQNLFELKEDNL